MIEQAKINGQMVLDLLKGYQSPTYFLYAAGAAVILFAIFGKRRGRLLFLYPVLLLILTVFNPFLLPYLFERVGKAEEKYPSFLIIIPVAFVLAGGITAVAFACRNKIVRALVLVAACGLVIVTGTPSFLKFFSFELPSNYQRMNPETVRICDYIVEHSSKDLSTAAFEDELLRGEAREYTAQIAVAEIFGSGADLTDANLLKEKLEELEPDYIVVKKDGDMPKLLEKAGASQAAYTDGQYIYKMK